MLGYIGYVRLHRLGYVYYRMLSNLKECEVGVADVIEGDL